MFWGCCFFALPVIAQLSCDYFILFCCVFVCLVLFSCFFSCVCLVFYSNHIADVWGAPRERDVASQGVRPANKEFHCKMLLLFQTSSYAAAIGLFGVYHFARLLPFLFYTPGFSSSSQTHWCWEELLMME